MAPKRREPDSPTPDRVYEGLARRYRPQTFDDVIGQSHVVRTLSQAITDHRWAAAYLFIGGRGLGKTTMARILAKSINCDNGPTAAPCGVCSHCRDIAAGRDIDVIEIDAASNTGVDNVRDVIIQAASTSTARARCKIFIIDETHMLSGPAFNALLKTIEEPPSHVLFILATTDGHRVPTTIRSRCQRFDFRPVSADELGGRLRRIAEQESIAIDDEAIGLITTFAEGGVRDALSGLDLIRAFASDKITLATAEEALGVIPRPTIEALIRSITEGDAPAAVERLQDLERSGADPGEVIRGLLLRLRAALIEELRGSPAGMPRGRLIRSIEVLLESMERQRYSRFPWLEIEVLATRLAFLNDEESSLKDLYNRLILLEGGEPMSKPLASPAKATAEKNRPVASASPANPKPRSPDGAGASEERVDAPTPSIQPAKKGAPEAASDDRQDVGSVAGAKDGAGATDLEKLRRIFKSSRIDVIK